MSAVDSSVLTPGASMRVLSLPPCVPLSCSSPVTRQQASASVQTLSSPSRVSPILSLPPAVHTTDR
eukprot:998751-Pleurochrysis_carterae.AAC.3